MSATARLQPSPGLGFGLRFFAWLVFFSALFWAFSLHENLGPLQRLLAAAGALGSQLAGGRASWQGDNIIVQSMVININHECTGIFVLFLYSSFVLAYPTSWRARGIGFAIGVPAFLLINVVRLATLTRIVESYPEAFFYFHEYVWQGVFMVFVLVGALAWAERFGE
jgi:archaeosortase B (VPXXXP-CTERM-specific)